MNPEIAALLAAAGVEYRLHRHAPIVSFAEGKAALPFDPAAMVKGLAFRRPDGGYAIVALCGEARADFKKIADALGLRRADLRPAAAEELLRDLDVAAGGVAPFPIGGATVLFDRRVLELDMIYCGAGRPGLTLEIKAAELARLAGGRTADLAKG